MSLLRISVLLTFPASLVVRFLACSNSINITDSYHVLPNVSLSNHTVSLLLHGVKSRVEGVVGNTKAWNAKQVLGERSQKEAGGAGCWEE